MVDAGATHIRYWEHGRFGDLRSRDDIARDGGALDVYGLGAFAYEGQTDPNGAAFFVTPFQALEPLTGWMDNAGPGEVTTTIYVAATTALDNRQLWFDLETVESSTATVVAQTSSRGSVIASGVALTQDSSDWSKASPTAGTRWTSFRTSPVRGSRRAHQPAVRLYG